jgi:hypothetical protein
MLGACSSNDDVGDADAGGEDAGLPDYACLTSCEPGADTGATSCEAYEECHNTGAGGYCVPPEDTIVPDDVIQANYSCLMSCGSSDAGTRCATPERCEAFNDQASRCVPAEVPCDRDEIAVSGFGCLSLCDPDAPMRCEAGESCRGLEGLETGACYPVDAG